MFPTVHLTFVYSLIVYFAAYTYPGSFFRFENLLLQGILHLTEYMYYLYI